MCGSSTSPRQPRSTTRPSTGRCIPNRPARSSRTIRARSRERPSKRSATSSRRVRARLLSRNVYCAPRHRSDSAGKVTGWEAAKLSGMRTSGRRRWGWRGAGAAAVVCALWFGFVTPPSKAATPACREIAVRMADGVRLDGWFRPASDGGRHPVLWTMTPYQNNACPASIGGIDDDLAVKFNVIRLSYRGFGASEGVSDQWGPQTAKDVGEIGNWIASQPWADGLIPTG